MLNQVLSIFSLVRFLFSDSPYQNQLKVKTSRQVCFDDKIPRASVLIANLFYFPTLTIYGGSIVMIVKNLCCVLNRNTGIHFEIARAQENGLKCLRMYVVVILWTQH